MPSWEVMIHQGKKLWKSLVHTNLFIIPLDNERRWYRYHQLFADLLQQQLYLQDKQAKEACVQVQPNCMRGPVCGMKKMV
jgi:ATP/maltotriose-dependent transcriptional regulator MalT